MNSFNVEMIDRIEEKHYNPQFARNKYYSLDGVWKCNGCDIRVPFAPESALSDFKKRDEILDKCWDGKLSYRVDFDLPEDFTDKRVILHFGAVDQVADVYLNDKYIGKHEGGYLSFSFDITEEVNEEKNSLRVEVLDTLSTHYPYGKQTKKRGGMWYTPVSGIWKSVWIENVPEEYIADIRLKTDLSGVDIELTINDGSCISRRIEVESPKTWSPENPCLYPIKITYKTDCVYSYFALRTIQIKKIDGISRVCLNEKPIFMHGVLDQGYWNDGLFTPAEPEKYDEDILSMKELGFNMLRKHIKIETPYFYYACDKYGMLICQDMVENGVYHYFRDTIFPYFKIMRKDNKDKRIGLKETLRRRFFIEHCKETVKEVYNHPSVIMYTIFNEGWGQFESDRVYSIMKKEDPDRLWDSTSGWFRHLKSDFDTAHIYYRNKRVHPHERPMFIKECGGYSLLVKDHVWNEKRVYGYGPCKSSDELTAKIELMYKEMVYPAIEEGLCGCIFTQLSDIEDEINGIYTYDRKVCKVDKKKLLAVSKRIYSIVEKINKKEFYEK